MSRTSRLINIILSQVIVLCTIACNAQNTDKEMKQDSKTLVAYFSATGTTAHAAERVAKITSGDLYKITPEQLYSAADLNWHDTKSRSSVEMSDQKSRPSIIDSVKDIDSYDLILIGYPIWWYVAPRVINTFIEKHNLAGKTIKVFATSGGSGIERSLADLKKSYPNLQWDGGLLMNGANDDQIRQWIGM